MHGSHLADPRRHQKFWDEWKAFEVKHGNEETFREMLRVQRSVAASFSSIHMNTASVDPTAGGAVTTDSVGGKRMRCSFIPVYLIPHMLVAWVNNCVAKGSQRPVLCCLP